MFWRKLPLMLVLLLPAIPSAVAAPQSGEYGRVAVQTMNRLKALTPDDFKELLMQAKAGNAESQYWIGLVYQDGDGRIISRDTNEAVRWFAKAADQDYLLAETCLGLAILHSNPSEGQRWLKKAAERGDAQAQFWLATGYERDWFGQKNPEAALRWYAEAAKGGQPDAQFVLERKYEEGDGVTQDYALAVELYTKAADQAPDLGGAGVARRHLAELYLDGRGVPQDYVQAYKWLYIGGDRDLSEVKAKLTPAQLAQVQQEIREWKAARPEGRPSPPF
jgi:hypothetical protein